MPYEPIDNDSDVDEFDVEKIEQMKGVGMRHNGIYGFYCPVCHGTGEIIKEVKK